MKIVIPGGTGQVGTFLARALHSDGHEVVVLSRRPASAPWRVLAWDAQTLDGWTASLEGADAVVNLAGRSVNCRYTPENRRVIMESRVNATRIVGEAIARAARPPRVWLQASTATLYAHRYDAPNDEMTGILGGSEPHVPETWSFSIMVARSRPQGRDVTSKGGERRAEELGARGDQTRAMRPDGTRREGFRPRAQNILLAVWVRLRRCGFCRPVPAPSLDRRPTRSKG